MALILLGTLGIVAFSALSWVIILAAVASLHSLLAEALDFNLSLSSSDSNSVIADALGLAWWMVWYQFLLLIAVSASAVMGMLKQHAQLFGNFFAALFAVQMFITHEAAIMNRSADDTTSRFESRAGAYLAGAIMCSMATAVMLVWLGILPSTESISIAVGGKMSKGMPGAPSVRSAPSGLPQYMATATGSTMDTPPPPAGGYAPHQSPHMPPVPPAPQGYHGYGEHTPPAPHEAVPPTMGMAGDNRYGNPPSF